MECGHCSAPLDRPGDFCLRCRQPNGDTVVMELGRERATVTTVLDGNVVGKRHVNTTEETAGKRSRSELRSFAGQIADEARRKRPEAVYATGNRDVIRAVRAQLHVPFYRIDADDPIAWIETHADDADLAVVDKPAGEKLGGAHSTVVGGRDGQDVLYLVAEHPHVKKIIPGPIDAGGSSSQTGLRAKVTRADDRGNLRLLVRDGSSVQENRVVTTAATAEQGERVRTAINDELEATGLQS